MKKRLLLAIILVLFTVVSSFAFTNKIEEDVNLGFELFSDNVSDFEIDIRNGYLNVEVWDGDTIKVEGKRYVQGFGDLKAELEKINLASTQQGNLYRIYLDYPKYMNTKINFNFGYSLDVFIPRELYKKLDNMILDTSNGNITMNNFNGNIRSDTSNAKIEHHHINGNTTVDTSNGEIILKSINGVVVADTSNAKILVDSCTSSVKVDTSNGPVYLMNINGNAVVDTSNAPVQVENCLGNLTVDTSSGNILLKYVTGEIVVDSSNGDIQIENCHFKGPRNELDTSNGSITGSLTLPESGKFVIKTTNNDIRLFIPADSNARYTADTSNGSIKIENISVTVTEKDKTDEEGYLNNNQGVRIELKSSNGDITLKGE